MNMDLQVRVDNEKIIVDIPQKGEQREFKNVLGLANGRVVSIGQSLADLIRENPQNEKKFREEVKFEPLYTASAEGLERLHLFLSFQKHQLSAARIPLFNSRSINLILDLPKYESIDENARNQFEFSLTKFVVKKLTINNDLKGWKNWQRWTLEISRSMSLLVWPFLWYWFILSIAFLMESLGIGRWLVYLAGLFVIYYLLLFIRTFILRFFLPHDLLRGELLSPSMGMGKYGKFLVKRLIDKE
ncbi:MAG: hypothetical protein Q8L87_07600 [Anaerolineales bacterium]|nr:hypothetical protein [Anaerolineales bacterium]